MSDVLKVLSKTCEKCKNPYQRTMAIDKEDFDRHNLIFLPETEQAEKFASNTEKSLCADCQDEFIRWMDEKGYLKTDCWCSHIEEFKKAII